MPTFVNISGNPVEMPSDDGVTPSKIVDADGTVEADRNPAPGVFDEAGSTVPPTKGVADADSR